MAHHNLVGAPAPGLAASERLDDRNHALLRSLGVVAAPPDVGAPQAGDDGAGRDRDQVNEQTNFATMQAAVVDCTCLRAVGDLLRQIGGRQ